jgi:preprotein translocase subunit YajC
MNTTEVQQVETSSPAQGAGPQQGGFGMLVPMLLILAIFYFMMIRPQQRKEKERRKMIEELRAGAKVVFAGGLMGTIAQATEKTFIVELAGGVKMEILRSSVQSVIAEDAK